MTKSEQLLREKIEEIIRRLNYGFGPGSERPKDPEVAYDIQDATQRIMSAIKDWGLENWKDGFEAGRKAYKSGVKAALKKDKP